MTPVAVSRILILGVSALVCAIGSGLASAELVAPTSLAATASSSSTVDLSWVEGNSSETGHSVERSGNPLSGFVVVGSAGKSATSFRDVGLSAGTAYYYRVRATGRRGAVSPYSAVAGVSTPSTNPTPTPSPTPVPTPAAPTGLTATAASSTQINLSWTDNSSNETAFKVERGPASSGPWTQIGTTAGASYADSGLAASTAYFYRTRAYNASGDSGYSNTAAATTPAAAAPPAAPASLSATAISSSEIRLIWADASSDETGFKIDRSTATRGWAQVGTVGSNATSHTDAGLSWSTSYSYRVRAYNASGDSAYSNTAAAMTQGAAAAGAHLWSKSFGGLSASASAFPNAVAVDGLGEIVVAGYFVNSVDLGSGLLTSAGAGDIFVAKYSSAGAPLWSRRVGSSQDDRGKAVAVDWGGNVYVTGLFRGTVDFGGGAVSAAPLAANAFLAKYSPAGVHLWSKRLSSAAGLDEGTALAVDGADNVVVAGILYQTSDFGGGPLATAGGADVFLVRLSSAGAHLWSRRMGGAVEDWATAVAVDAAGNPSVAGYYSGSADFGQGALTSAGGRDLFVARYDVAGAPVWSRRFGGPADDVARGLAVDSGGNAVVAGNFLSASMAVGATPLTNAGGADIYLARIDPDGLPLWAKRFGSTLALDEKAQAVSVDGAGNILLTGSVVDAIDFGGGLLASDGWYDIFLAKFSSTGAHTWSKRTGAGAGQRIAADGNGNVVATGEFSGSTPVSFGGATLSSPGGTDMFLVKIAP
jgi:hypothetical protein